MVFVWMEVIDVNQVVIVWVFVIGFCFGVQGGDIEGIVDGFQLCWVQGKFFYQILFYCVGNCYYVVILINLFNFLLFYLVVKVGVVFEIGGREYVVQIELDVMFVQCLVVGDDVVGFVQVGEYKVKLFLLFGLYDCGIQLVGVVGQFGQFVLWFMVVIGNYLVVEFFG